MKRTKLAARTLPDYTPAEERFNSISHIVGAALGVLITALCLHRALLSRDMWAVVSSAVYGATLILMFTVSGVYHGMRPGLGKKVMQVVDHCDIYFLIAGTYTPILLVGIRPHQPTLCWVVFGVEWGLALLGAAINAIDLKQYEKFSMLCYLGMGWAIVFACKPTLAALTWPGFMWILLGGVAYTVGAVFYGLGKKKRYMHAAFHVFVDIGAVLQALGIYLYVL